MRDTFSGYHPVVNFTFFLLVLIFSMFFMHPACLLISLLSSTSHAIYLNGRKGVRFSVLYMLPLLLLTALVNPAFNHEGITILTYLPSGNPLTLESMVYGVGAACMLISVMQWFSCYNAVMTSDKFVYLFGRIIPALSLVLSMALRFVPRFRTQLKVITQAQRCVGRDISTGSLLHRLRCGVKILSIMVTWALENAIETADSMKCRGYGLPGRTAFSIFKFDGRDLCALLYMLLMGGYVLLGSFLGGLYWRYYPSLKGVPVGVYPVTVFAAYLALCIMPVILNIREDKKWKHLQSAI